MKIKQPNTEEERLKLHLTAYKIPFSREYKFHPERRFRFDFAIPQYKLAIEIEGGLYLGAKGGHTSARGYMKDMEKYNIASRMGWIVLRFSPAQVRKGIAILEIRDFIQKLNER